MNCEIHQIPMKTVPAGVSKRTGQPYSAFLTCPEKGCSWKPQQSKPYVPPAPTYTVPTKPLESREDYGRRLAIHGMVNGMLANGIAPHLIPIQDLIKLEDRINDALDGKIDDFPEDDYSDIPF